MLRLRLLVEGRLEIVGERAADDQRHGPGRRARVHNDRGDWGRGRGDRPSRDEGFLLQLLLFM